jgi:hypothetical protein
MRETRRNLLKAGAGMATTGALASLAGCSGQIPEGIPIIGGGGGASAFYRQDLYAPGTVSDRSHYRFGALTPMAIAENEDEFDDGTFESLETYIESKFGNHNLDMDEIETLSSVDGGAVTVITGDYTAEDIADELEDNEFDDETETDNGYTIYLNASAQTCTAVSSEAIFTIHNGNALSAGSPIQVGETTDEGTTPTPAGPAADRNVDNLRSINVGETVRSQLTEDDPNGIRGYYEPVTFSGESGTTVEIRMQSEPGDTFLFLENPSGEVVARNDDYNSLNSRILHSLQSSGEYRIIATSYSSGATFPYTLSLSEVVTDLRSIEYGQTKSGRLDQNDPTGQRGFYEPVTFTGSEGDVIRINMRSGGDTYLMLQDPDGNIVAENDDYNGLNSQIDTTLGSSGEFTIIATSFDGGATFPYELQLQLRFSPDEMVSAVEGMVGVKSGNTDRLVDAVSAASDLAGAIGGGTIVSGVTSEPIERDVPENGLIEGAVARGYAINVDSDEGDLTAAAVFEDEGGVDAGDVEDWVDSSSTMSEADDLQESEQGRVGIVEGVIDTDDL